MPEETNNTKAVEVDYVCDVCKKGRMRPTGIILERLPPLYVHKCNKCGQGMNLYCTYPTIRFATTGTPGERKP